MSFQLNSTSDFTQTHQLNKTSYLLKSVETSLEKSLNDSCEFTVFVDYVSDCHLKTRQVKVRETFVVFSLLVMMIKVRKICKLLV